jgi:alanyl-tRNA synthetase
VHHLLDAPLDDALIGRVIHGEVLEARRRDHMAQHTGQHMLSCALLDVANAETVSSRLGSESSTIDLGLPTLDEDKLLAAEDLVNRLVLEDRPVRIHYPSAEALAAMPLRRRPKVDKDIRVIEVVGFDFSPCGGTHCERTGQVGMVRITKTERYKGMTRVTFLAGPRTLLDYRRRDTELREVGRALKCGPLDVMAGITRLRADTLAAQEALGVVRAELMQHLGAALLAAHPVSQSGTTAILSVRPSDDIDALRALASALTRRPDVVAFCATRDPASGDYVLVVDRGKDARFDAGAWLKARASEHKGRGGGRPDHAEGRLPGGLDLASLTGMTST